SGSVWSCAKLRAEAPRERLDNPRTHLSSLLVGERPVERAEGDAEGERLLSRRDLAAAVLIEDLRGRELGLSRLANERENGGGRRRLVDDEREILADLRIRTDLAEHHVAGHALHERVEIELEGAPGALENARVQLAEPPFVGPRRFPRMEE